MHRVHKKMRASKCVHIFTTIKNDGDDQHTHLCQRLTNTDDNWITRIQQ